MNMCRLPRGASRFVINRALERDEYDEYRIAPLVEIHLIHDFRPDHFRSEQVGYEMTGVDVRHDYLSSRDLVAICETHSSSAVRVADNLLHKCVGTNFAAMCSQVFSQRQRHAMHSAFDQVVPGVLQD